MAFRQVIKAFFGLSPKQQEEFLRNMYSYSPDIKIFVESKLGLQTDFQKYLTEMHRETVGKIYRKGTPGTPNGKVVNSIIIKAQKAQAPVDIMLELEQLAFRGFIEFLNKFGGGPDSFDDLACKHLEAYLLLVQKHVTNQEERQKLFTEVRRYLREKNNMYTDSIDEVFAEITGMSVGR
jgi:hypothetical protein